MHFKFTMAREWIEGFLLGRVRPVWTDGERSCACC